MASLLRKLDPPADFIGQSFSYRLVYFLLIVGDVLSFLAGIIMNNLVYSLYGGLITAVVTFCLTVPSWPYFRRHPPKFKKAIKDKDE